MKKILPLSTQIEITNSITLFKQHNVNLIDWKELVNNQYSHNSLLSFQNDWKTWVEYCVSINAIPLPANIANIRKFIELKSKTRKISSIKRYIVTLSLVHRLHCFNDPTRHREVRYTLNRLCTEKSGDETQATPFHLRHLRELQEKFDTSSKLKDIRDLLIWTLSLEAILKRSDLATLTFDALKKMEDQYHLHLHEQSITLSADANCIIDKWLTASNIQSGPIFRRINKHQQLGKEPMDHSSIYRVFRRAASELGLDNTLTFSGQSPRVGASRDLSNAGKSIKEIQYQGRWKSPAMPAQYVGNTQARNEAFNKFKQKIEKD